LRVPVGKSFFSREREVLVVGVEIFLKVAGLLGERENSLPRFRGYLKIQVEVIDGIGIGRNMAAGLVVRGAVLKGTRSSSVLVGKQGNRWRT